MAQMINLSCGCGYKKDSVTVGEGITGVDLDEIRRKFTEQELVGFESALDKGGCSYFYGSRLALCDKCDDLVLVLVLRYFNILPDATLTPEQLVVKNCPDCNGAIVLYDKEPYFCPKCTLLLDIEIGGYWD
jgi:hypothetical protein